MATPGGAVMERPYGWGWALALAAELEDWDDPDADRWAAGLRPLARTLEQNFLRWLPRATYPQRTGVHTNGSFGISRALPYADRQPLRSSPTPPTGSSPTCAASTSAAPGAGGAWPRRFPATTPA
jgi:hypothetical protein